MSGLRPTGRRTARRPGPRGRGLRVRPTRTVTAWATARPGPGCRAGRPGRYPVMVRGSLSLSLMLARGPGTQAGPGTAAESQSRWPRHSGSSDGSGRGAVPVTLRLVARPRRQVGVRLAGGHRRPASEPSGSGPGAAWPGSYCFVISSSVRCPVLVHGNAYPSMELRQSSQTTPDCCAMGRVTQFGVNADLVPFQASLAVHAAA